MAVLLVFALPGVAFAGTQAKKILITSTKQISPSVLKKLKGANGTPGAQGPSGGAGSIGPAGPAGSAGKEGAKGTNGENGISVTSKEFAGKKEKCEVGGSEFKSSSGTTYACNGSPWTVGTLPSKKTETGTWSFGGGVTGFLPVPISFPIPLGAPLDGTHVHVVKEGETAPEGCVGTYEAPTAEPGYLCVYVGTMGTSELFKNGLENPETPGIDPGAGTTGALLVFKESGGVGFGTWAVTAP